LIHLRPILVFTGHWNEFRVRTQCLSWVNHI
jgi:hypothetical protein